MGRKLRVTGGFLKEKVCLKYFEFETLKQGLFRHIQHRKFPLLTRWRHNSMATTSDIRNGMVIEHKGRMMKIISFLHVKPGKGGAFVRTKLKNVITGQVVDETFRGSAKIKPVRLESKNMQYLYSDGDNFVFMDMDTFEQLSIPNEVVGDIKAFLKDGMMVKIQSIEGDVIGLEPPVFVELEVTDTEPGVRGNTATGATKPAKLETGHTVTVPLFVNQGEILKVDTRTGKYVERVK